MSHSTFSSLLHSIVSAPPISDVEIHRARAHSRSNAVAKCFATKVYKVVERGETHVGNNISYERSDSRLQPSDILSISSDSENDYDNRKPGLRPVEPSPNIAKKRKLVDAAAQTNSEPTPKESWHPRYRPDNHRIKIVSEDGVAFSVEISGLAKRR